MFGIILALFNLSENNYDYVIVFVNLTLNSLPPELSTYTPFVALLFISLMVLQLVLSAETDKHTTVI